MITTTYTCDRCGAEDTTNKIGVAQVGIHIGDFTMRQWGDKALNNQWCKGCREEFGLFLRTNDTFPEDRIDDKKHATPMKTSVLEKVIKLLTREDKKCVQNTMVKK